MAEHTDEICGNCGKKTVLFCDNMFTDFVCTSCGQKNLFVALQKVETEIPCKDDKRHDVRITKGGKIFCPICFTELGKMVKTSKTKRSERK